MARRVNVQPNVVGETKEEETRYEREERPSNPPEESGRWTFHFDHWLFEAQVDDFVLA